jgi:hypothetical protein
LLNLVPNLDYYYKDANNLLSVGLGNWSNATVTEQALGLSGNSHNMAWQAQLLCHNPHAPTSNDTLVTDPPVSTATVASLVAALLLGLLLLLGILLWAWRQACNCLRKRQRKSSSGEIELHATRYNKEGDFVTLGESDGGVSLDLTHSELEQAQATGVTQTALWLTESDQSDLELPVSGKTSPQDPQRSVRLQQAQKYIDNKKSTHSGVSMTKKND